MDLQHKMHWTVLWRTKYSVVFDFCTCRILLSWCTSVAKVLGYLLYIFKISLLIIIARVFLCECCFQRKRFYKSDCMVFLHFSPIQMSLNQSGLWLKMENYQMYKLEKKYRFAELVMKDHHPQENAYKMPLLFLLHPKSLAVHRNISDHSRGKSDISFWS